MASSALIILPFGLAFARPAFAWPPAHAFRTKKTKRLRARFIPFIDNRHNCQNRSYARSEQRLLPVLMNLNDLAVDVGAS
jgi:hypothetical protein